MRISNSLCLAFMATIVVLAVLTFGQPVHAGSGTLTTPAIFDTIAQQVGGVLAFKNARKCAQFGQPANCVALPGCVTVPLTINVATGSAQSNSCTLYTLDGPGELAYAQDALNGTITLDTNEWNVQQQQLSFCTVWKALTGPQRTQVQVDLGTTAPPPCQ